MMYKEIELKNFRGIEHLKIEDIGKINLLVGKNNCGKTTILESIFLLTGANNPELSIRINALRSIRSIDGYSMRLFFNRLDIDHPPTIHAILKHPKEERTLKITPKFKSKEFVKPNIPKDESIFDINYSSVREGISGIQLEYIISKSSYRGKGKKIVAKIDGNGIYIEKNNDYKEELFGIFLNSRNIFSGLADSFTNVLIKKDLNRVVRILQKIEPDIKDISMGSDGIVYCDTGLEKLLPINVMGDGIVRLLAIILAVSNAQNGIVLIDEIENGFHPSSQRVLWDAIFESSKEFNTQIFATTHSIEAVRAFNNSYSESNFKDEIRLFRIEKYNNNFKSLKYTPDVLAEALERGWEVR